MIRAAIICASILVPAQSFALGCNPILSLTREVTTASQAIRKAQSIKNVYCEGSSFNSSRELSFGLDAVVEQIPIGLKLGSGSTKQKIEHVCSNFESWVAENGAAYSSAISTPERAIAAWESCVAIQAGGSVTFDVQISKELLVIGIKRGTEIVEFRGAHYNAKNLSCFGPFGKDGETVAVDRFTRFKLEDDASLPLTCQREYSDEGVLPFADLAVNVETASLLIPLQQDAKADGVFVSDLENQVEALESQVVSLTERNSNVVQQTTALNQYLACARSRLGRVRGQLNTAWGEWKRIAGTTDNDPVRNHYITTFMESSDHGTTDLKVTWKQIEAQLNALDRHTAQSLGC